MPARARADDSQGGRCDRRTQLGVVAAICKAGGDHSQHDTLQRRLVSFVHASYVALVKKQFRKELTVPRQGRESFSPRFGAFSAWISIADSYNGAPYPTVRAAMRIQIASDLHLEMRPNYAPDPVTEFRPVPDRDVLVLAGDIGTHTKAWSFIAQELKRSPVIYVPGNHEYYSWQTHEQTDTAWRSKAKEHADLHYLTGQALTLDGVCFWGGPWYSDLFGRRDRAHLRHVENSLNDFSTGFDDFGRWTISRHLEEHARQTKLLREHAGLVDVVVTHWPPTLHAVAPRFQGDTLNGYFVNDREDLVEEIGAQLWISGHVHDAFRCVAGETLCIGNPAGYPHEGREVTLFRSDLAVYVAPVD